MYYFSQQLGKQLKTATRKASGDKNSCNRVTTTETSNLLRNDCTWLHGCGSMVLAHALIAKGMV